MSTPNHKRPSFLNEPSPKKSPSAATMPDWMLFNPAWRISKLEMHDPYGWHLLDARALHNIRDKLKSFESMKLNEIFVQAKKFHHSVPVEKLCPKAKKRLEELRLSHLDELHSLRLSGEERIWGILTQNVIALLWWDPDHEVCPCELKNS